jgi:SnoaL-like domain
LPASSPSTGPTRAFRGGGNSVSTYFGETYAAEARDRGALEQEHEHICGGRYLDRFERRDDVWRIAARRITNEWNQCQPNIERWEGRLAAMRLPGSRDRHDPVYANSLLPAFTLSSS